MKAFNIQNYNEASQLFINRWVGKEKVICVKQRHVRKNEHLVFYREEMEKIIKKTKALRFELFHGGNEYGHEFDNVPDDLIDEGLIDEDYFDDNGDLCDCDCALIPVPDNYDNSEGYEIVDVEIIDTTNETEDFDDDDLQNWIDEHENFMYWDAQDKLIQQI